MEKISIYEVRSLGEKIQALWRLCKHLGHPLFRMFLCLVLPLVVVESLIEFLFSDSINANLTSYLLFSGVTGVIIGYVVSAVTYGLLKVYVEHGDAGFVVSLQSFKPTLFYCLKRNGLLIIVSLVVAIVAALLFVGGLLLGVSTVRAICIVFAIMFIALEPPLAMWPVVYLMEEDTSLWSSLLKSLKYGFKTWISLFALLVVLGLLVIIVAVIIAVPAYVLEVALQTALQTGVFVAGFKVFSFAYSIIGFFIMAFCPAIVDMGVTLHYGGIKEMEKIDQYE